MQAPCSEGDHIRLTKMPNDPNPIPVGTKGVVTKVMKSWDGKWHISVKWEIERSLALIAPVDEFEVIG